jgi:hypothetical protein
MIVDASVAIMAPRIYQPASIKDVPETTAKT